MAVPAEAVLRRRERLCRWWHTLRHHRASQLARRLAKVTRGKFRLDWPRAASGHDVPELVPDEAFTMWARRKLEQRRRADGFDERVRDLRAGVFRFLNERVDLGAEIDWTSPKLADVPRLWRFQFEYQEWVLDLATAALDRGDQASLDALWTSLICWIDVCPPASVPSRSSSDGDRWHPYCLSRRIPSWLTLWAGSGEGPAASGEEENSGRRVRESLAAQARHLAAHLERDLGGNHLLENARALVLAGIAFRGGEAERWLRLGGRILNRELPRQVLAHGEHFERSPMYHCQMLEAVIDVRDVTGKKDPALSRLCDETARRMAEFLTEIMHPDGEIPLLGDSCFGETASAAEVLLRCGLAGTDDRQGMDDATAPVRVAAGCATARQLGDYWVWRDGGDFLLFDAGAVGADELPAHAHADLLTIEASVGGRRLIVDSGVHDYEDGAMRRYCRSTAAHNVLEIDGTNQCDVWSRFRMGRRGRPSQLQTGESSGFYWAAATHDGYRFLGVERTGRWIGCQAGGAWIIVDWAIGTGEHRLANRLHLHPDVEVVLVGGQAELSLADERLVIRPLLGGELTLKGGWYCPEFGRRLATRVLTWESERQLPVVCGWQITRDRGQHLARLSIATDGSFRLNWTDVSGGYQSHSISLPRIASLLPVTKWHQLGRRRSP